MHARQPATPPRVANAAAARARFGPRFDALVAALGRSDDLADLAVAALDGRPDADALIRRALAGDDDPSLPDPLRALVARASATPAWVDPRRLARARQLFRRAGPIGGLVLAFRSLVGGYVSRAGNKPLVFSGRLQEQARRRLSETGRFVNAVIADDGLRPGGDGLTITLHVRLIHARIRRLLSRHPRWDHAAWGLPINQHDMLATIHLFSIVFTDGLRRMGVPVSESEADDYLHLWRRVGEVIGVEPDLMPRSARAAREDLEFIYMTNGEPDDDSRALTRALLELPRAEATTALERRLAEGRVRVMEALTRRLLGDATADGLGLSATPLDRLLPWTAPMVFSTHLLRRVAPRLDDLSLRMSAAYWRHAESAGLDAPATFPLPDLLLGAPR